MILDLTTGEIICILIAFIVFGFFAWLLTKKIPKFVQAPKTGALIACIPSFIICFPLYQLVMYPLHVIDKFHQGKTFILVGSSEYDTGNGTKAKVSFEWGKAHVVNQSDDPLTVEIVWYGLPSSEEQNESTYSIPPHAAGPVLHVDYYPNETPPQQVESKASTSKKYWLRIQQ